MSEIRPFVNSFVERVKGLSKDNKKNRSYVDLGDGSFCNADGSAEDLLKCLVSNMKEFKGEMMVCVSQSDLPKSDASLRAVARKIGVSLKVKRKVAISGIDDGVCLKISKEDRKILLKGLS